MTLECTLDSALFTELDVDSTVDADFEVVPAG